MKLRRWSLPSQLAPVSPSPTEGDYERTTALRQLSGTGTNARMLKSGLGMDCAAEADHITVVIRANLRELGQRPLYPYESLPARWAGKKLRWVALNQRRSVRLKSGDKLV